MHPAAPLTDDCFAAVILAFMSPANPKWEGKYSDATKDLWGRELRRAAQRDCLGGVSVAAMRPALVQAYLDGIAGWPAKQSAAYSAIKAVEKWAVVRDLLPRQITLGVEVEGSDDGHIPWTPEQVALAERYARPDLARAVTLGANTGQRGSDLIRMGEADREVFDGRDGLTIKQIKTGREIWVPITQALAEAMKGWERRPGPYLTRPDGRPWTRHDLSNQWAYERDHNRNLEPLRRCGPERDTPLVLHGLRGYACVQLLRAGVNTRQISDVVGMSEKMVARYTRFSVQKENASAAIYHLERTGRERAKGRSDKTG